MRQLNLSNLALRKCLRHLRAGQHFVVRPLVAGQALRKSRGRTFDLGSDHPT